MIPRNVLRQVARPAATAVLLVAGAAGAMPLHAQQADVASGMVIRGARVFDGEALLGVRDVLVQNGRIVRVGDVVDVPSGTQLVDGRGRTLLPGFIDGHTHTWGSALVEALAFGVTTELDMFSDWREAAAARAEQEAGNVAGRADLFSAGTLVTAPGGHGTQYGMTIPTLTTPAAAQEFVDDRIAEGSDWIKIVHDDGHAYGMSTPTIDEATMRAVIAAAARRNRLAVVHVGDSASARRAIEAGADGLVHLFLGASPPAFARLAAERNVFVVPTLSVLHSISGAPAGASLLRDARLAPYLSVMQEPMLGQTFAGVPANPAAYAAAEGTLRALRDAGVAIVAGTDAGNPGTAHGVSMHGELELLVAAGLTPVEALAAATAVAARAFRLDDRGRIAEGLRADLLLVDGDPTTDITATRAIVGIWKGGERFDRDAYAAAATASREAAARGAAALVNGLISDFEGGGLDAALGAWMPSPDSYAGGRSTGTIEVVAGGAGGSGHALHVSGEVVGAIANPWYGVMWSPGAVPMTPADLSAAPGFRFMTRGDGASFSVHIFSQSHGMTPLTYSFDAAEEWSEVVVRWADLGIDGSGILGVVIAAGPEPGAFSLFIDDVRLR